MQTPKVNSRRVKLLGAVLIDGARVEPGAEVLVNAALAANLVHRGKAEIIDEPVAESVEEAAAPAEPQSDQEQEDHAEQ